MLKHHHLLEGVVNKKRVYQFDMIGGGIGVQAPVDLTEIVEQDQTVTAELLSHPFQSSLWMKSQSMLNFQSMLKSL